MGRHQRPDRDDVPSLQPSQEGRLRTLFLEGQRPVKVQLIIQVQPLGARFSIDLVQKSSDSNEYLIYPGHMLPVLAKATMHALLAWNYWTHDLQEASPIRRDEEEPS